MYILAWDELPSLRSIFHGYLSRLSTKILGWRTNWRFLQHKMLPKFPWLLVSYLHQDTGLVDQLKIPSAQSAAQSRVSRCPQLYLRWQGTCQYKEEHIRNILLHASSLRFWSINQGQLLMIQILRSYFIHARRWCHKSLTATFPLYSAQTIRPTPPTFSKPNSKPQII